MLTRWVGGSEKGPKHAYVIYEWSLNTIGFVHGTAQKNQLGELHTGSSRKRTSMKKTTWNVLISFSTKLNEI